MIKSTSVITMFAVTVFFASLSAHLYSAGLAPCEKAIRTQPCYLAGSGGGATDCLPKYEWIPDPRDPNAGKYILVTCSDGGVGFCNGIDSDICVGGNGYKVCVTPGMLTGEVLKANGCPQKPKNCGPRVMRIGQCFIQRNPADGKLYCDCPGGAANGNCDITEWDDASLLDLCNEVVLGT